MTKTIISPDKLPDLGIALSNDQRKRLEADGKFPKRVTLTERTHGYVIEEIQGWIASRVAARDDRAA